MAADDGVTYTNEDFLGRRFVIYFYPRDNTPGCTKEACQFSELDGFRALDIPVLGVVENMSTHICSQCGHEESIFGTGGGVRMAEEYDVPLLGQLPLALRIREDLDQGCPTVVAEPDSELTERYRELARRTAARLSMTPRSLAGITRVSLKTSRSPGRSRPGRSMNRLSASRSPTSSRRLAPRSLAGYFAINASGRA